MSRHVHAYVTKVPGRAPRPGIPSRSGFIGISSPNYHLEDLAYAKLILHALKYPHQTVNGVLLGHPPSSGIVVIVDAVPLQHHWTNLSPMMEVGLGMVRSTFFSRPFFSSTSAESRMVCTLCGCRPPTMPIVVGFM
jgi:hypothetical protein